MWRMFSFWSCDHTDGGKNCSTVWSANKSVQTTSPKPCVSFCVIAHVCVVIGANFCGNSHDESKGRAARALKEGSETVRRQRRRNQTYDTETEWQNMKDKVETNYHDYFFPLAAFWYWFAVDCVSIEAATLCIARRRIRSAGMSCFSMYWCVRVNKTHLRGSSIYW